MASPRFGHPHSQNPSDTASYPDVSLSLKMCWQRKGEGQNGLRLPYVPFPLSLAIHHQSLAITVRKTKRLRRSVLVIWASPVTLTLTLTQIAKVIWEGRGCPYHYRVLGMGMPKTRGCPYHCNSGLSSTQTEAFAHPKNTIVLQAILTQRFVTFGKLLCS